MTEYNVNTAKVLWQSTTDIGCAVESCNLQGYYDISYLVCNYSPR